MPVQAIIPPDATIAGGIVIGGQTFTVRHNQLSGNTAGKIERMREGLQDYLDVRIDVDDLPLDDEEHTDHVDNASLGYNTYGDPYKRGDNSLIDERAFYYQKNPNSVFLIHRNILADIILVMENDPTLGGEDRYVLSVSRLD